MYDHHGLPDGLDSSHPAPSWVKLALGVPFLAFLLSTLALQVAGSIPGLAGPARTSFLVALACVALGLGSVFLACLFHLARRMLGGARGTR